MGKSIGAFIAALRKANGLTQKDLADRLNVSDKTVSRWERDEGTPDLSLIPVIAEIFGVTCDELLCGMRISPDERQEGEEAGANSISTAKGKKERNRLFAAQLTQYKNHSYIAIGVAVLGLIAAMMLNLGFLRAMIGFFVGLIFLVVSVVCQVVFLNSALATVEGLEEDEALYAYKRTVIRVAERTFILVAFLFGVLLPLLLVDDMYAGLSASSWLTYGLCGVAFALIFAIICWAANASLVRSGRLCMAEAAEARYWKTHRLQRNSGLALCAALAVTLIIQLGVNSVVDERTFSDGTSFDNYDSFVAYIERNVSSASDEASQEIASVESTETSSDPEGTDAVIIYWVFTADGEEIFYDEDGAEVTKEYVDSLDDVTWGEALTDSNGAILCSFVWNNSNVVTIDYGQSEEGYLPITVYDEQDVVRAEAITQCINIAFVVIYLAEIITVIVIYRKRRDA